MKPIRHSLYMACMALLAALLAPPAWAGGLPPLSDPPTGEYRHGKFVWIDLVTGDPAGARRFYGELFGWAFAELGSGSRPYTLAYQAGSPVAGIVARQPRPGQARQALWIAFLSVPDVDRAAAEVTARGGKVLIPTSAVEGRGRMAVLADPDGAPFGIAKSASGDPPDYRAEPGEWIWAVYQSGDAASAAAFYQDIAGYEVVPGEDVGNARSFALQAEGFARASLVEIPAERAGELRPDWLFFVRVRDLAASVARASALGGRVIVPPRPDLLDGRLAVIGDPSGAPLGLMEWRDDDGEGN